MTAQLERYAILICMVIGSLSITGCEKSNDPSATSASPKSSESPSGSARDTQPDEVVFAFQPQENPEALRPDADAISDYMSEQIGVTAEVFLPTSYAAVVEALRADNADVAYFSGWPYLIAHQKADVELLAAEVREGRPFYHSQWYVSSDSDIQSIADLEGRSISFTSPLSTCGYLFPLAEVIKQTPMKTGDDPKSFFGEVIYAGGYQQSLQALLNDRVEAAAASDYAPEIYLSDEERNQIRVLSKQGPVPTHGVAVRSSLPDPLKSKIQEAFLSLEERKPKLLKSLYGAEDLVKRTHEKHVGALADALETVGADQEIEGFGAGSGSGHGSGSGKGSGSTHGEDDSKGSGEGSGAARESGASKGSGVGSGHGDHHHEGASPGSGEGAGSGE